MNETETLYLRLVKECLTRDLLKKEFSNRLENPFFGHCFHASEALYYLLGGGAAGYKVRRAVDDSGTPHYWIITKDGEILDPTDEQYISFGSSPPYVRGKGASFNCRSKPPKPSKRAQKVMECVRGRLCWTGKP